MADPYGSRDERDEARARLKASVDALAERTNLQVQMQKEPLKMLGGASAVGALLGVVAGRQLRRSKKVYVDAASPVKDQKAFLKAQQRHKGGGGVGGALVATLGTLAFKALQDRVITPRLEELANGLLERAGQTPSAGPSKAPPRPQMTGKGNVQPVIPARPPSGGTGQGQPVSTGGAASFLKGAASAPAGGPPDPAGVAGPQALGVTASDLPGPRGTVEAKAQGSPIAPQEKANPNLS